SFRWLILFLFGIFALVSDAGAATYSLSLRYKPAKDFPLLREKIGENLGLAPFKDERQETLYIGYHLSFFGSANYFRTDPFPLERAIQESLLGPLFQNGIKTTPISAWDGKPDSLKELDTDSVLMIEIKQFWMEGSGAAFRTHTKTSVHLVVHLGVKKEGKVFSKNVEVNREVTLARLTPERVEGTFNEILREIFDSFFSNPY
ncbi:MAG: hypothetical protein ACUVWO_14605, partial [Thermodesulfobacteriota bacterium]